MPTVTAFDNAYFLQSIGWAIGNSFWQAGLLWVVYYLVTAGNKNLPALFKYNLSILFLFAAFVWFCFTGFEFYYLLSTSAAGIENLPGIKLLAMVQSLNNLLPFISVVYFVLLAWYVAKFMYNALYTSRMSRYNFTKAPADIRIFTINTALHLGIKKKVQVWLSDKVDVPSVIGFVKPVILLPIAALNQLDATQVETILLHELAHIKRNDFLINLLQSFVEVILFFNPFAILLGKAARKERENCCDDWVLNFKYNSHEYAKALLLLEEQRRLPVALALAATNGKKDLLHRIKRMFAATPQISSSFSEKIKLAVVAALLLISMIVLVPSSLKKNDVAKTSPHRTPALILTAQKNKVKEILVAGTFENKLPVQKTITPILKIKRKSPVEKEVVAEAEKDWTEALVNEELFKPNEEAATIATKISETETDKMPELLVKIEEEQSGVSQKNTYYFQMKDELGNPVIKPLVFLNKAKKMAAEKKLIIKPARKKRITT